MQQLESKEIEASMFRAGSMPLAVPIRSESVSDSDKFRSLFLSRWQGVTMRIISRQKHAGNARN